MSPSRFRVASYNVHGCVGRDGVFAPERIVRVINEFKADVIALQEVVAPSDTDGVPGGALHLLTRSFVGHSVWAPAYHGVRHDFGNLLLSRWPIVTSAIVDLAVRRREPRNAIDARLAAPFGPLQVIATHLGLRAGERRRQVDTLHRLIKESDGPWPTLLAGDLNAWYPFSNILRLMGQQMPLRPSVVTFPTPRPFLALDRILLRAPGGRMTVFRHHTEAARIASDHFPVVADIDLEPPGPPVVYSLPADRRQESPMTPRSTSRTRSALGLAGFVTGCLAVSAVGGAITASSVGSWYPALAKPSFTPPSWLFPPVWTALFVLMGVAAWRVWRQAGWTEGRPALGAFAVQLLLNLAWSFLFFGMQWVGAALAEIIVLLAAIAWTTARFARVDRPAALLLVPYALWVSFAAVLTAAIWLDN
ncbi:tryptophan-rich sensory protein [Shumkonia mesophila]|uniref:tryptophan-rich sensory protein n=1 Tax=Shumkonia mesophila TaxID=2838854 RepID=UPI002934113A|nr:tryptophan-rich sensory protein [Shumkonia mesophila]